MLLYIDKVDFIMTSNSIGLLGQVPLRLGKSTINAIRSYSFLGEKEAKKFSMQSPLFRRIHSLRMNSNKLSMLLEKKNCSYTS